MTAWDFRDAPDLRQELTDCLGDALAALLAREDDALTAIVAQQETVDTGVTPPRSARGVENANDDAAVGPSFVPRPEGGQQLIGRPRTSLRDRSGVGTGVKRAACDRSPEKLRAWAVELRARQAAKALQAADVARAKKGDR